MSIYEHRNGLASTIEFRYNRKKQDKLLSNHNFSLHIFQQKIHHSGDQRYSASKWYSINFQWVLGMQTIRWGRRESTELLGMSNLPWQGFEKTHLQIAGEIFGNWGSSSEQNRGSIRTKQSVIC